MFHENKFVIPAYYTKIERNKSQLFKEFYVTDLPVSVVIYRLQSSVLCWHTPPHF